MRRWGSLLVAAIAAVVGAFTGMSAAVAADDNGFEDAIAQWEPGALPEGAVAGVAQGLDDTALSGCMAGELRPWNVDERAVVTVLWMRCGTADAAAARLAGAWSNSTLFVDGTGPSGPGAQSELTARAMEANGDRYLYRMWSQGEYYLAVGRLCDAEDAACTQASAADAEVVRALSSAPANPLALPERVDSDPLLAFEPTDPAGWALKFSLPADTTVQGGDARCGEGLATQFADARGDTVKVFWVDCPSLERAQELVADYWSIVDSQGLTPTFANGLDGVTRLTAAEGWAGITRWWIQGTRYVQVERWCGDDDEARCAVLTADDARSITGILGVQLQPLTNWNKATASLIILVGVPIATYLVILIPRRLLARRRQRELDPGSEPMATAVYRSVDEAVRRAHRGRIVRRTIVVVAGTATSLVTIVTGLFTGQFLVQISAVFLAPVLIFFGIGALLDLVWRPNRLLRPPRLRGRPSLRGIGGFLLRGLALVFAVATIVLYLLAILMTWSNGSHTETTFRAQIEQMLAQSEGVARLLPYALLWLWDLQRSGAIIILFFVIVAVPIFLAYLLDRLGRRLAQRSLRDTLAQDDRRHFLYLRGFDEDGLRIDESLGRRGFLELFSPFGRPRFEEVLAEHLSSLGPVIAISGSKQRLQDLGAAKVSLGGDTWQDQVREWVGGARAVVLSATPSEVRAGLEWEIEHLATRADAPPLILVISPWPPDERRRRWEGFLATAGEWPLFRRLVEQPPPSATHILTHSREAGWIAYGARRRWDWSYAASILTAIESGDLDHAPALHGDVADTDREREPA